MARTRRLLTLLAVALLVASVLVWQLGRRPSTSAQTGVAASGAPASPASPSSPSSSPGKPGAASVGPGAASRAPSAARSASTGCSASSGFVPTRFSIGRLKLAVPVVPVDEQSSKGTMAPPVDQPWEVAWIDTTNKPGSRAPGVINLTAHTYHAGGAIGNSLYSTDPVRTGDLIVLSDGSGHSACYRLTKRVKFAAASYASNSTVFYDQQADPQVRLMICWDYNWGTREWDSRVVFYADPVKA